ncbi:hypothetical protein DFJ73DRAFT_312501 [Zopfochytrium polystomum]|nr:hypothetical protein DFJ73DRAFT_312501 [Zopfochytrium polystomum]
MASHNTAAFLMTRRPLWSRLDSLSKRSFSLLNYILGLYPIHLRRDMQKPGFGDCLSEMAPFDHTCGVLMLREDISKELRCTWIESSTPFHTQRAAVILREVIQAFLDQAGRDENLSTTLGCCLRLGTWLHHAPVIQQQAVSRLLPRNLRPSTASDTRFPVPKVAGRSFRLCLPGGRLRCAFSLEGQTPACAQSPQSRDIFLPGGRMFGSLQTPFGRSGHIRAKDINRSYIRSKISSSRASARRISRLLCQSLRIPRCLSQQNLLEQLREYS